jgi:hypothetical protein
MVEADLSGMTFVPNFVKFFQELNAGTYIADSIILPSHPKDGRCSKTA